MPRCQGETLVYLWIPRSGAFFMCSGCRLTHEVCFSSGVAPTILWFSCGTGDCSRHAIAFFVSEVHSHLFLICAMLLVRPLRYGRLFSTHRVSHAVWAFGRCLDACNFYPCQHQK